MLGTHLFVTRASQILQMYQLCLNVLPVSWWQPECVWNMLRNIWIIFLSDVWFILEETACKVSVCPNILTVGTHCLKQLQNLLSSAAKNTPTVFLFLLFATQLYGVCGAGVRTCLSPHLSGNLLKIRTVWHSALAQNDITGGETLNVARRRKWKRSHLSMQATWRHSVLLNCFIHALL